MKALHDEDALMSVISWRSGRKVRVCRSALCAETRAMVDLEDELFAWSEMFPHITALENSLDEMARLVPGACVTDSKGSVRQTATHCGHFKREGASRVHRVPALEGRVGIFRSQAFLGTQWSTAERQSYQRHRNGASRIFSVVIFDPRFMTAKRTVCSWNAYTANTKCRGLEGGGTSS